MSAMTVAETIASYRKRLKPAERAAFEEGLRIGEEFNRRLRDGDPAHHRAVPMAEESGEGDSEEDRVSLAKVIDHCDRFGLCLGVRLQR
jgi:hypothetical protein